MSKVTEIQKGYKKTKVGMIPEDWTIEKIDNLCDIKGRIGYRGYTVNDIVKKGEGAITVSPSNIAGTTLNLNKSTYISWFKYDESPEIQIQKGDILLVKTGSTFGKSALVKDLQEKATINPQLVIIKNAKINVVLLSYYIADNIIQKQIYSTVVGGAIPTLSQENILKFTIPLPPLPEQEKIAAILSTWDEGIQLLESTIKTLKKRNKGLAQQLLTGKLRLRSASGEKFDGEWVEKSLGELFLERKDIGFNDLPLLSIGEKGVYPQSDDNKKDSSNKDKSKYKRICAGDIGYNTMRMWQGRSALSNLEGIVSPAYTIVKPKKDTSSLFFAKLFKLDFMTNKFFRNSQGLVNDTLNCKYKDFKIVKVMAPSTLMEQEAIAKVLETADAELQLYQQKLNTLQEQKKGLMQKLLTGEVRVKV